MKTASGESGVFGETRPRAGGSWPLSRWLLLILFVFAAHLALIFIFGSRKPITPMAVKNTPKLELAADSSEWLMLNDPTLFALPGRQDFAWLAWLRPHDIVGFHRQDWTEAPRWLQLSTGELGVIFSRFMETNRFATFNFELKPPPQFTVPLAPLEPEFAEISSLRIEGGIAGRPLLTPMKLPSWPYADVIASSQVQVLVNAAGEVISAVLLPSNNSSVVHDADADQRALELARAARFAPASDLTFGQLIFNWCTVPPPATNAAAGL